MTRLALLLIVAAFASISTGCAGFSLQKAIPWSDKKEDPPAETPTRLIAVWTEQQLHHADRQSSTRGFGGRVMFFANDPNAPIKAAGKLVVYAYDETEAIASGKSLAAGGTPTRKYEFKPDKFAEHYAESAIGHSYNFWIPWDEVGGEQRIITLAPMLLLDDNKAVPGEPSRCVLKGRTPLVQKTDVRRYERLPLIDPATGQPVVRPVGYEEPVADSLAASQEISAPQGSERQGRRMETATIPIPPSLARRGAIAPAMNIPRGEATPAPRSSANRYSEPLVEPAPSQSAAPGATAPTTYSPPPRDRFELARYRARATQAAPPTTAPGMWEQYRSRQPAHR